MSPSSPPSFARWLLTRLVPRSARAETVGDLADLWAERVEKEGRRHANRWYWRQVGAAIRPSLLRWRPASSGDGSIRSARFASTASDIRFALKQLCRHPGVGVVVVITLALGIGATTAIFSAVHGVLLRSLPYDDPAELVVVTTEAGGSTLPRFVSGPDLLDLPEAVPSLQVTAGFLEATVGPMTEVERPEHILTAPVTWNVFETLGVEMALGRRPNARDGIPLALNTTDPPPIPSVISHDFWQRSFGGDPEVVGKVVHVWGGASEIIGVLPEGFQMVVPPELNIPPKGDIWRVIRWDMASWSREWRTLRTIARLADGATPRQAQQELDNFASQLRATYAHHEAEQTAFRVAPLQAQVASPMRAPLWLLMGAVTLVLLIACANVANILLARGAARAGEMTVRASLGAERGRLVRQLLTESAVLAAIGAASGVVLAKIGLDLLQAIRPEELHRLGQVSIDLTVLAFAVALAVGATLLSGLLPALQVSRSALSAGFGLRGGISSGQRSRAALVVTEVALSVVLLVGAGLLIRSFTELQRMPLGFEPERVLTVTATQSNRPSEERQVYESELLRAAVSVPGVTAAGIVFPLPMNGVYDRSAEYAIDGRHTDPSSWQTAYFRTVSPTYFDAIGLGLMRGRGFTEFDENYEVPIVILDERLASREFAGVDPIGQPLWVRGMGGDTLRAEIVGVVEYAPQWDHRDTRPTMYFPRVFYQSHEVSLVARTVGSTTAVATSLSAAIRGVDPGFPSDLVPMERYVGDRLAQSRFLLILMQIFGALALSLSAIGLYGVLAYSVRQRTKELGVRLALGAQAASLTRKVVGNGLQLAAIGVAIGLGGALLLGRALRSQLFQVGSADPIALAGSAAVVLAVALIASLIPAMRAARVDPVTALREE